MRIPVVVQGRSRWRGAPVRAARRFVRGVRASSARTRSRAVRRYVRGGRPSAPIRPRLNPLARALWAGSEGVVTLGLVLLLLVAHQLWWTNREARHEARQTVRSLEGEWERNGGARGDKTRPRAAPAAPAGTAVEPAAPSGADPSVPAPGPGRRDRPGPDRAYAVLRLPSLGVTAPIAEGISKHGVLDKGYVGHYTGTAQPGRAGNFALAGHRNTHGEPFRRLDRLRAGDRIVVETRDAVFTYLVDKILPETSARDGGVIAPVPRSDVRTAYGYGTPGYYVTLTTCTPEFTSRYRLVVWGTLASKRPR